MNKFVCTILCVLVMLFAMNSSVFGLPTEVDKESVSININQFPGSPLGLGGQLAAPYNIEQVSGFVASSLQSNGSIIRGKYHGEAGFDFSKTRILLYLNGTTKGYSLTELGTQTDIGVNFEWQGVGSEMIDISGGIFGRDGGAFGKANAFDQLSELRYDENELETFLDADGRMLSELNPAATGLTFRNRKSVKLRLQGDINTASNIGINVALMPELFGSDEEAADQLIGSFHTDYQLGQHTSLDFVIDIGFQRFRESGNVESEASLFVGIKIEK